MTSLCTRPNLSSSYSKGKSCIQEGNQEGRSKESKEGRRQEGTKEEGRRRKEEGRRKEGRKEMSPPTQQHDSSCVTSSHNSVRLVSL